MTPGFVLTVGRIIHVTDEIAPSGKPSDCIPAIVTELPRVSTQTFGATTFPPNRPPRPVYIGAYSPDWHDPRACGDDEPEVNEPDMSSFCVCHDQPVCPDAYDREIDAFDPL